MISELLTGSTLTSDASGAVYRVGAFLGAGGFGTAYRAARHDNPAGPIAANPDMIPAALNPEVPAAATSPTPPTAAAPETATEPPNAAAPFTWLLECFPVAHQRAKCSQLLLKRL